MTWRRRTCGDILLSINGATGIVMTYLRKNCADVLNNACAHFLRVTYQRMADGGGKGIDQRQTMNGIADARA